MINTRYNIVNMKDYLKIYEEDVYTSSIISQINTFDDLYNIWLKSTYTGRDFKISHCYIDKSLLYGRGLELGFGLGTSIYWLIKNCKNITKIDAIDFNIELFKLHDILEKEYPDKIGNFYCTSIHKLTDYISHESYDFVNASSIFEHVPDKFFWTSLEECYKILKPNGYFGVYNDIGNNDGVQHIRVIPQSELSKEIQSVGFKKITDYLFYK